LILSLCSVLNINDCSHAVHVRVKTAGAAVTGGKRAHPFGMYELCEQLLPKA
jgi:hypothetical protein